MRVVKIRTAILISSPVPNPSAKHICFLNPLHPHKMEVFYPKITVATPSWECMFSNPTVRYLQLGNEGYHLRPEKLISESREYVFISQMNQNRTSGLEYVLKSENVQKLWGFGMQKKPVHVFDISISNYTQVAHSMRLNIENAYNKVGPVIENFELVSDEDTSVHVGEITNIQSYSLSDFNQLTQITSEEAWS